MRVGHLHEALKIPDVPHLPFEEFAGAGRLGDHWFTVQHEGFRPIEVREHRNRWIRAPVLAEQDVVSYS